MRGLGWSLVAVLLVLQARAAAQHLEWRRIDRWGNVVLDLSKERGILDVEERNGLIAVRYEQGYRLFRAADGAPIPGWFSKVSFNRTRTGAIRKRPTGLHFFDLQGRDTLAPYWKAGLEPLRELNRDLVVAHDKANVEHGYGGPKSVEVCYDVESTVAALDGLEIERAEVARRTVETEDGTETALDTLVVARRPR